MTTTEGIRVHPVADQFPMMSGKPLDELAEDIKRNGLEKPIELLPDGRLIDGRNRLRACHLAGVEPHFVTVDPENVAAYVMSANKYRRHLTSSQLAALAALEIDNMRKEALERKREGGKKAGRGRPQQDVELVPQPMDEPDDDGKSREKLAKKFGTNSRYVQDAARIKDEAPEVFEKLKSGEVDMPEARIKAAEATGKRAKWAEDTAIKRAAKWVADIAHVSNICEQVNLDTVKGDESFRCQWVDACKAALRSLRTLLNNLEK